MVSKSYTPDQIMNNLREADILLNQGNTLPAVRNELLPYIIGGNLPGLPSAMLLVYQPSS